MLPHHAPQDCCGLQEYKDDNGKEIPFCALNTNSEFEHGANCGRWIRAKIGKVCFSGTDTGDSACSDESAHPPPVPFDVCCMTWRIAVLWRGCLPWFRGGGCCVCAGAAVVRLRTAHAIPRLCLVHGVPCVMPLVGQHIAPCIFLRGDMPRAFRSTIAPCPCRLADARRHDRQDPRGLCLRHVPRQQLLVQEGPVPPRHQRGLHRRHGPAQRLQRPRARVELPRRSPERVRLYLRAMFSGLLLVLHCDDEVASFMCFVRGVSGWHCVYGGPTICCLWRCCLDCCSRVQ